MMVSSWSIGGKTVESLVINNKEVQSIVRVSDGAVLYQKAASHSYALAFSSATYQTDSSGDVTVSVTLTDNGVPVSGETVSFSDGSSVYTGITNNNGVASLNYNCQANKTLTASFGNVSASCSIISNYVPSVVLSEPITYTVNCTVSSMRGEVVIIPCIAVGDPVDTISGLYNPPMTPQEFLEYIMEGGEYDHVDIIEGEPQGGFEYFDMICYAIAYDEYEDRFYTIDYSTTTGSDITITISDN